jgi:HEAT repeat protein/energy-coupling factor transporter ATP-binding protein EcfA2
MRWSWDKKDELGLARFVIDSKDSEAVKTFIEKAVKSSHLPKSEHDSHQTHNDGRRQLVEKIYNALRQKEVEYALNEYHEFSENRQRIRRPDEILDTQGKGTCLDLAILFCAICWRHELLPILILVEGHALAAVSLTHSLPEWKNEERRGQQLFWEGLGRLTDARKLQNMVKREDYLAIECTGFAKSETLSEGEEEKFQRVDGFLSFDQAVEWGCKQLEKPLKFALDIHMAYNFWLPKVCRERLDAKTPKRLINSPLTNDENPLLKLYVPLGLIERKPDAQRRPSENASPPEESPFNKQDAQYEVVREYNNEEFLDQVLKHKSSTRSQGKRLAIVGDPGAGKTTLLQKIAYWVLEEEQGLPIWISLANVNEDWLRGRDETDEGWLYRYLSENWLRDAAGKAKRTPEKWQQTFEELIESGQVWLLLDGADEMALRHPLTRLKQQLTKGWAKSVRVVLSCRLNLWEEEKDTLSETFDIYRTLEFNYPNQVHQFINNWFGEDDSKAKELKEQLEEDNRKRIQDLVKNPLRLALLCRIWKRGRATLPETKADFYRLLVKEHYKWKDDSTNKVFTISGNPKKELNRALGQLARNAIDSEKFRFRLRESFIINHDLGEPDDEDSLFWRALKLGWLIHVGYPTEGENNPGEKVYAFVHPTFQEYFAATVDDNYDFFLPSEHRDRPIKNKDNPDKYKGYRIFERQWKEAILLWLGRSEGVTKEQKEEFIRALVQFEDGCGEFYKYQAYFLAASGIAEFNDCNRADEIVKQIVEWRCWHLNSEIKQAAREALRETDRAGAISALVELLKTTKDESTRRRAADSLGRIDPGNQHAIKALVELLNTTKDEYTRGRAADSLGEIDPGNQHAIKALVEQLNKAEWLNKAEHEHTRWRAAERLGRIDPGNQDTIKALVELLNKAVHEYTRWLAADSLGRIDPGNQDTIKALMDQLNKAEDEPTRWRAAYSLGAIDPGNQDAIKAVVEQLNKAEDESTRLLVAESLGKIDPGNQHAIKALVEQLNKAEDEYTRWRTAYSLGEIGSGNQDAINALVEQLNKAEDEYTRRLVAESLGAIDPGNQDAINALVEQLNKAEDEYTRRLVAESLGEITQGKELRSVVSGLKSGVTDRHKGNNFQGDKKCYQVIWHCMPNMTYPAFYQAWHQQEEIDNTTTPNSQSLNQANLQESLQSAIANDSQLSQIIHLICIDTSKFIESNNPTAKIYVEMVKQGCSKSDDGIPKTMQDLQVYWDLLTIESDSEALLRTPLEKPKASAERTIVLMFYTSFSNPTPGKGTAMPCPYSETFLTDLSKFEGAICVVTDQPFDHIPLKYFTPSQPIEDVMEWIRAIAAQQ